MDKEDSYVLDNNNVEKSAYKRKEIEEKNEQPMGDVYDVYAKAVGVHSKLSKMSEDYVLTRYNIDVYNQKFPKFIREQRKLLRIIKSYIIIPLSILKAYYNTDEKAKEVHKGLQREYNLIEELIIGELDECVIMGRTPQGEVIKAFLQHGLNEGSREIYDVETENPSMGKKIRERTVQ